MDILQRVVPALCDFFRGDGNFTAGFIDGAEVAVLIEVADDRMARQANGGLDVSQAELPLQVVGQRRSLGDEVLERRLLEDLRFTRARRAVIQVVIETLQIDIAIRIAVRFGFRSLGVDVLGDCLFALADLADKGFRHRQLQQQGIRCRCG